MSRAVSKNSSRILSRGGQMKTINRAVAIVLASSVALVSPALAGGTVSTLKNTANVGGNILQQGDNVLKQGDNILKQGDNVFKQGDQIFKQGDNIFKQGDNILKQGDNVFKQGDGLAKQGGGIFQKIPDRPLPDPRVLNPDDFAEAVDEFGDLFKGLDVPNHPPGYQIVKESDFLPEIVKNADAADDLPPLQKFKNNYEQPLDELGGELKPPPKKNLSPAEQAYEDAMNAANGGVVSKTNKLNKPDLSNPPKFTKNAGGVVDNGVKNAGKGADNVVREAAEGSDDIVDFIRRRPQEIANEMSKKKPGFLKYAATQHPKATVVGVVSVAAIAGVGGWLVYDLAIKPALADKDDKENQDGESGADDQQTEMMPEVPEQGGMEQAQAQPN